VYEVICLSLEFSPFVFLRDLTAWNISGDIIGVLRPVDFIDGAISTSDIKYIDRNIGYGYKRTELTGDELLITVRGTTGITALSDERFSGMNVTKGIAVIRYNANIVNPIYLNEYIKSDESQWYPVIKENWSDMDMEIHVELVRDEGTEPWGTWHIQGEMTQFIIAGTTVTKINRTGNAYKTETRCRAVNTNGK
jgi:hypothetical protein